MQSTETQAAPVSLIEQIEAGAPVTIVTTEIVAPTKRVRAKPAATAKQPKAANAAKPVQAPVAVDPNLNRAVASAAVSAYYNGASLPFKSALDRFADLRLDKAAKRPSQRQAAMLCTMLAYSDGNIDKRGQFTRGAFKLPATLFNPKADKLALVTCQPETGCLSDMLGRVVHFVSGPTSGKQQASTVLRIDFAVARREISEQIAPSALRSAALAKLDALSPAKPAKAA